MMKQVILEACETLPQKIASVREGATEFNREANPTGDGHKTEQGSASITFTFYHPTRYVPSGRDATHDGATLPLWVPAR